MCVTAGDGVRVTDTVSLTVSVARYDLYELYNICSWIIFKQCFYELIPRFQKLPYQTATLQLSWHVTTHPLHNAAVQPGELALPSSLFPEKHCR